MARLDTAAMHQRRVKRMLLLGSGMTVIVALGWGIFFLLRGDWFVVGFDLVTMVIGLAVARLTWLGHTRAASRLLIALIYVVLSINAALLDVPIDVTPRSTHELLMALGLVSCLLMRDEPPWLRHGVPLLCFATYVVFSCSSLGWVTPLALPASVREGGVWVNHALAMLTVFAVVHVMQNDVAERNGMESELRDALVRGEMLLHYQPQVAEGGRVVGAEALVRWNHPRRGMVPPGDFIPLAEQSGLMPPLGDWVLRTACAQLALWRLRPETSSLVLAVNVSAVQFAQDDFVSRVLGCVAQHDIDPTRLKLELTESMLAHDIEDVVAKMSVLKARGIGFSLDDFGTGFSSLSYLRRLPLDQLKIDQSFVRNMLNSPKEAAIANALVSLGRSLGLDVIAEGVETEAQRDYLRETGCTHWQGYLFSRPVPAAEFDALLAQSAVAEATPPQAARVIESDFATA